MPSFQHQVLARVIPRVRRRADPASAEVEAAAVVAARMRTGTAPPLRIVRDFDVTGLDGYGFHVHDLRPREADSGRTLLYVHGGGYVSEADRKHWRFVTRVARRLGMRVVFPVYPLAPANTWRDAHPPLLRLFEQVAIDSPQGVVLAGDSAGGGMALGLALQLKQRPGPQPTHLVLISPWVDLTGETPGTLEAAHRDPWLRLSRMRLYGEWWAGEDDPARWELSPVHGDLWGLAPTLLFCGTRDLLLPQNRLLVQRAREAGSDVTYVEEPDLLHVFPILPVPEGRRAQERTVTFLT